MTTSVREWSLHWATAALAAGHISATVSDKIADVVIRQRKQFGIRALGNQGPYQPRLGVLKGQRAGERRERVAAIGIRHRTEIIRNQPQLVIAAWLVGSGDPAARQNDSCEIR